MLTDILLGTLTWSPSYPGGHTAPPVIVKTAILNYPQLAFDLNQGPFIAVGALVMGGTGARVLTAQINYEGQQIIDWSDGPFRIYGATVLGGWPGSRRFSHIDYGFFALDLNAGPFLMWGASTGPSGATVFYRILQPKIEWRLHPRVPPPMQYTTADGSLVGAVDGLNDTFTATVLLDRWQVYVNGVCQQLNVQCVAPGGAWLRFLPGFIPQKGDIVTVEGWIGASY
jgi:hypothetical protein